MNTTQEHILDNIARSIVFKQSFDFGSFEEAVDSLTDYLEIEYEFDRLSLQVYRTNIDARFHHAINRKIVEKYKSARGEEAFKMLGEYSSLFKLFKLTGAFKEFTIRKDIRPDFVLCGKTTIGIEVTEFVTECDAVFYNIVSEYNGSLKTSDEISQYIKKKHGKKADRYAVHCHNGKTTIYSPLDSENAELHYVFLISKKYEKYKKVFSQYDEFILLCDATASVHVTDEQTVFSIVDTYRHLEPTATGMTIYILWKDCLNKPKYNRFIL